MTNAEQTRLIAALGREFCKRRMKAEYDALVSYWHCVMLRGSVPSEWVEADLIRWAETLGVQGEAQNIPGGSLARTLH